MTRRSTSATHPSRVSRFLGRLARCLAAFGLVATAAGVAEAADVPDDTYVDGKVGRPAERSEHADVVQRLSAHLPPLVAVKPTRPKK